MKKFAGISMFLMICLLFAFMVNVEVAVSSDSDDYDPYDEAQLLDDDDKSIIDEDEIDDEDKVVIPDVTDMTLGMQSTENVMPENFRGGDPDSGLVHVLEDVYYVRHEHALIYEADSNGIAEGTKFESDPNITWNTQMIDADGNPIEEEEDIRHTNRATDGETFATPGEYQIGNSGARQVSAIDGVDDDKEGDKGQSVTAQQSMGVQAHDVTPPDLWIAFQETAGSRDIPQTEAELLTKMQVDIIKSAGKPFTTEASNFAETNYLFVEEGNDDERNKEPWNKTTRVTAAGTIFNKDGAIDIDSGVIDTLILDENDQTRLAQIVVKEDDKINGIYVRRNVPFIFTALATDNGDRRKTAGVTSYNVEAEIFHEDGSSVEKVNDAYIFRVPNYPVNEHREQEVYTFKARAKDLSGNLTEVVLPVYVIDSYSSFQDRGR